MKKILIVAAFLFAFFLGLYGFEIKNGVKINNKKIDFANTTWESFTGMDIKYHDAYENCVSLMQNPGHFYNSDIDTGKFSVEIVTDLNNEKVQLFNTKVQYDYLEPDKEYWCFKVGGDFFYTKLVCNPETNRVIGYLKEESCILEKKYWKLYENCVFLIKKFNREAPYIKKDRAFVDLLQDDEKDKIQLFRNGKKEYILQQDKEYLCFTIGEPGYCVKLVCNPETNEIIGYVDDKIYSGIFSGANCFICNLYRIVYFYACTGRCCWKECARCGKIYGLYKPANKKWCGNY